MSTNRAGGGWGVAGGDSAPATPHPLPPTRLQPAWSCSGVTLRYPGATAAALDGITLDIPAARCTAVIGPNGSGKSTLLRVLLGALVPDDGVAAYRGRPVGAWPRAALAREVGAVAQAEDAAFSLTVRELVALGRYPHLGPWRREGPADAAAVERAMARCDVDRFAGRALDTLSGGERQRARVARALAQEPATLALDEPTAALDVRHEMEIFELLRALRDAGATVLVVTHHLNLAARYADQLVLLNEGRVAAMGPPAAVLTQETVKGVYGWPVRVVPHPGPGADAGAPQVVPLGGGR